MRGILLFSVAMGYAGLLFLLAVYSETRLKSSGLARLRMPAYALALAVYCSSWTFYGAVGSSISEGWNYAPIYLGPILLLLFAPGFLRALVREVEAEGAASISDFIGSRFGKSRGVAALVTLLALFGSIPYLALQLRSIGTGYAAIAGGHNAQIPMTIAAIVLALFAMAFGARRYVASGRNEAVLHVIAAESLVKLAAMMAVGLFAGWLFFSAPPAQQAMGASRFYDIFALSQMDGDFLVITLLSMAAFLCLPRQFYIGVIGADSPDSIMQGRWITILYLLLTMAVVMPISLAGLTLPSGDFAPDLLILGLPLVHGADGLAFVAFLGGFSAATGMVVVEAIALFHMLSNDLIGPVMLRFRKDDVATDIGADMGRRMLHTRRVAIVMVMAAALVYAFLVPEDERLAAIGLTAFAAMVQFAPILILAVRGGNRDALAAKGGLIVGLILWIYTLFLPELIWPELLEPLTGTLLDPHALMGVTGLSSISHGTLWSLGANSAVFAVISLWRRRGGGRDEARPHHDIAEARTLGDLRAMATRFVGKEEANAAFGPDRDSNDAIEAEDARRAERLIAGVIGGPSARQIMASALQGTRLGVSDVMRMLDESGQSLQFSKGLLAATLENIDPGVSVIDHHQRLMAWNSRYLDLFKYPKELVYVGAPVSELIRYNATRGECGPGEVDSHVARRLGHMRRGTVHSFERMRPDGRVLKTVGGPMPGGGYVMCFTDITAEAEARSALERARSELESRVEQRTRALRLANEQLSRADAEKTRFLAAASHDLLQPIHAARLFTAGLGRQLPENLRPLLGGVSSSIEAAEALLRSLLDISKLDAGGVQPQPALFPVRPLLMELAEIFTPQAQAKGLTIRVGPGDAMVESDRSLLQSIIQNFLSNAMRYTMQGGVVMGVRRRQGMIRIEVYDSGPGIEERDQDRIFQEFERLGHAGAGDAGIGLGLAIVRRTARLLDAAVDLRSTPGRGSRFAVELTAAAEPALPQAPLKPTQTRSPDGVQVLVVDDDAEIRAATAMVLRQNGYVPLMAAGPADAYVLADLAQCALVDYQLAEGDGDGISLIAQLRLINPSLCCALVTADRSPDLTDKCRAGGADLFHKPASPEQLLRWLGEVSPV
ncbi:MAG: hybrid sensor histidine kinase/response regulator [Sphingobium sp.]|nr:hybrid sensor histidine kinase/response regulator [Sphingobium sp.]